MKKIYYIVSKDHNEIIASKNISIIGQLLYSRHPKERPSFIMYYAVLTIGLLGVLLSLINSAGFLRLKIPPILALWLAVAFFAIAYSAIIRDKVASGRTDGVGKGKHVESPWSDPYRLVSRYPDNDPSKKTYYIIDSEKNAIVDVKRLGKWGQAYITWRGKRQKQKTE